MSEIVEIAKAAGQIGGLGWVAVLLYFLWKEGIIGFKKPVDAEPEMTPQWATKLMTYVNHDQTEKIDKLISVAEVMAKGFDHIKLKHEEWEKYGVPTRCVDKK